MPFLTATLKNFPLVHIPSPAPFLHRIYHPMKLSSWYVCFLASFMPSLVGET